jgi:hypothetical protein
MKKLLMTVFATFAVSLYADEDAEYAAEVTRGLKREKQRMAKLFGGRVNTIMHLHEIAPNLWDEVRLQMFPQAKETCQEVFRRNNKLAREAQYILENYTSVTLSSERRKRLHDAQAAVDKMTNHNNVVLKDMLFLSEISIAPKLREMLGMLEVGKPEQAPKQLRSLAIAECRLRENLLQDLNLVMQLLANIPPSSPAEEKVFRSRRMAESTVELCYSRFMGTRLAAREILGRLAVTPAVSDKEVAKAIQELADTTNSAAEEIGELAQQTMSHLKLSKTVEACIDNHDKRKK